MRVGNQVLAATVEKAYPQFFTTTYRPLPPVLPWMLHSVFLASGVPEEFLKVSACLLAVLEEKVNLGFLEVTNLS